MGDDSIDMIILHIDMGYLVTLLTGGGDGDGDGDGGSGSHGGKWKNHTCLGWGGGAD